MTIVGHFSQSVRNVISPVSGLMPHLATINADFTLTLGFNLNDLDALTNLHNIRVPWSMSLYTRGTIYPFGYPPWCLLS